VKTEIIYGIHPVYEALAARRRQVYAIYLMKEKKSGRLARIESLAESGGVGPQAVGRGELNALAGTAEHQGVAARVSPYPLTDFSDLLRTVQAGDGKFFLLMLDHIVDPQNLGAVIRTALCVGVDGVILPKDRCASPTPAVSKASAGALEHIRLTRVTNMVQTIQHCKRAGIWIIGLQKEAAQSIYSGDLTESIAIVLGGEQKGIRPLVQMNCDFMVSIPQRGPVGSLNASAAAAVAMYEAFRQRQKETMDR
jgi:23S rRNA (guanosine2251-2'-O)-methyltransferase